MYHSVIEWTSSMAIGATCFPSFPSWSPFVHSLDNHDLGLQYTISQLPLLTASSTSSPIIAAATPILFKCSTWSFMMAINGVTTTIVNGILSCLHSNARFIRGKSWKIRLFTKPVGKIAKTPILPTSCFKQFLCSSRLASTFGKSLSAVFVVSSNSAWRDVESVITSISHFSLWSKTLHCWQKLSKSTNRRVYPTWDQAFFFFGFFVSLAQEGKK